MENKILKNELNLGESGFYYVRMKFANKDMPLNWFDVFQVDEGDYITDITHGEERTGKPEIIYITSKGLHLRNTETFKTKEQALQYAKKLNTARVCSYLDNLMEASSFLTERELLDLNNRVGWFLREITARSNVFEKTPTEENKELRERVNTYEIPEALKELLFIDYSPRFKENYLNIAKITEEHKYFKTIKEWLEEKE